MSKDIFQIKKENNELATKIIKSFLQNDNLSVDVTEDDTMQVLNEILLSFVEKMKLECLLIKGE